VYVPAEQGEHEAAAATEYMPAGQVPEHDDVAKPVVAPKEPEGQAVHELEPAGAYMPATQ